MAGVRDRRGSVVAAIAVGAVLRLAWVIWATRAPNELRDPAEYLRIAVGLTHGQTPRFGGGGDPSAFWPPGYPALLAPFVWVARVTGWASAAFVASLFNVVAGTVTIALSAFLAGRWLGDGARAPAAWLVALCPGLIYWTSTAHTETAFTPFLLGAIAVASVGAAHPSTRRWIAVGALVAAGFLVRSPGLIGLAAPALAIRAERGSWHGALRATGITLATTLVLLVPWTVRNGLQVGIWSPASTNNAGAVCFGHHDGAQALWNPATIDGATQQDCYGGSPYDDRRFAAFYRMSGRQVAGLSADPDEAAWYRSAMGKGIRWAATHPVQELTLEPRKLWQAWSSDGQVVDGARNYQERGWAGSWQWRLGALANLWGWIVGALALVALVAVPRCRRAAPLWAPIVLYTLAILGGVVDPHYRYPVVPLVAVLAAGLWVRGRAPLEPKLATAGGGGVAAPPPVRSRDRDTAPVPVAAAAVTTGTPAPLPTGPEVEWPGPVVARTPAGERWFARLAPFAMGTLCVVLAARGLLWAALVLAAVLGLLLQARLLSPAFRDRSDRLLAGAAHAIGHAVGTALSWVLLSLVFVVAILPFTLVGLVVRRPLGRPRGIPGDGWVPRTAMASAPTPRRGFGSEPGRTAPTPPEPKAVPPTPVPPEIRDAGGAAPSRRPAAPRGLRVLVGIGVVTCLVLADLAFGVFLTTTGLRPGGRGDVRREVEGAVHTTMATPPIAGEPWADEYGEELIDYQLSASPYVPYLVQAPHAFESRYLNTTATERRSYEPAASGASRPLRVAFFGGSVLFGVGQRDAHTIPSEVARIAAEEGVPLEVHNYGFPGWVSWQEMQYLERLLAAGQRYDLVVFYDGFNEFLVQGTDYSVDPTHLGAGTIEQLSGAFHHEHEDAPALLDGLHALASAYRRNSGIALLFGLASPKPNGGVEDSTATPDEQADAALDVYGRSRHLVDDLLADADTPVAYFWQPQKAGWPTSITDRLPAEVTDLTHVFDGREDDLYIDEVHTNEEGAHIAAQAIWDEIGSQLGVPAAAGGPAG